MSVFKYLSIFTYAPFYPFNFRIIFFLLCPFLLYTLFFFLTLPNFSIFLVPFSDAASEYFAISKTFIVQPLYLLVLFYLLLPLSNFFLNILLRFSFLINFIHSFYFHGAFQFHWDWSISSFLSPSLLLFVPSRSWAFSYVYMI